MLFRTAIFSIFAIGAVLVAPRVAEA